MRTTVITVVAALALLAGMARYFGVSVTDASADRSARRARPANRQASRVTVAPLPVRDRGEPARRIVVAPAGVGEPPQRTAFRLEFEAWANEQRLSDEQRQRVLRRLLDAQVNYDQADRASVQESIAVSQRGLTADEQAAELGVIGQSWIELRMNIERDVVADLAELVGRDAANRFSERFAFQLGAVLASQPLAEE